MTFKIIVSSLLPFSILASAIAGGGISRFENETGKQEAQRQQEQAQSERLPTESGSNIAQRGNQVDAVDPTIVPNEGEASRASLQSPTQQEEFQQQEKLFQQRKELILALKEKYQDEDAMFYLDKALKALQLGFEVSSSSFYNADSLEKASLAQQRSDVYNSIVCDYVDAAKAIEENPTIKDRIPNWKIFAPHKTPKPYLEAIGSQEKILSQLHEFNEFINRVSLNEKQQQEIEHHKAKLRQSINYLRAEVTRLRTRPNLMNEEDVMYSGPRFFPEMPH